MWHPILIRTLRVILLIIQMLSEFVRRFSNSWKSASYRHKCFILVVAITLLTIYSSGVLTSYGKPHQVALAVPQSSAVVSVKTQSHNANVTGSAGRGAEQCSVQKMLKPGAKIFKPFGRKMPKIFHQTYKTTSLPTTYRSYIVKCRNLNPDWDYYLWRDEDIEEFMIDYFPSYRRKYKTFHMNVQRADFIRYMVLYHYGGIYLDMDVECVKPFFPSLEQESAFLDQERKEHSQILYNVEFMAMNSAMGSVVGHPFYLSMLESIVNADDKIQGAGGSTGPDRLSAVYKEWASSDCMKIFPVTLLEPVFFSPIADTKLHNFYRSCNAKGKGRWKAIGCKLMRNKNWQADFTDNRTVGRHLFLHMGYDWGPKSRTFFEASSLGSVKLYKQDRMQR